MQTIKALLGFPNGTPIDSVQAKIVKTYKQKEISTAYGPKTIQDGLIEDDSGAKIKIKVWSHPDITPLEGKSFVIHASSKGKGLTLKHESYVGREGPKTDIVLEVGKDGQFQHLAVYAQSNPAAAIPAQTGVQATPAAQMPVNSVSQSSGATSVHGATAGLATNKAVEILVETGYISESLKNKTLEDDIVAIGGQIVRAALRLEKGDINHDKPETKVAAKSADVPKQDGPDEDVPF